jgi:hypothetical protein
MPQVVPCTLNTQAQSSMSAVNAFRKVKWLVCRPSETSMCHCLECATWQRHAYGSHFMHGLHACTAVSQGYRKHSASLCSTAHCLSHSKFAAFRVQQQSNQPLGQKGFVTRLTVRVGSLPMAPSSVQTVPRCLHSSVDLEDIVSAVGLPQSSLTLWSGASCQPTARPHPPAGLDTCHASRTAPPLLPTLICPPDDSGKSGALHISSDEAAHEKRTNISPTTSCHGRTG